MGKSTDELRAWALAEEKKGLVDIGFFPGSSNPISLDNAARSVLVAVTGEGIDITNEPL